MTKWGIFKCQNCGKKFKEKFSEKNNWNSRQEIIPEHIGQYTHIIMNEMNEGTMPVCCGECEQEQKKRQQAYISTKLVRAERCNRDRHTADGFDSAEECEKGYKIFYPDGYESWCPEDVFEKQYLPVIPNENLRSDVSISQDIVNKFIAEVHTRTMGDKTTVVRAVLVNGFEIVESSACVDSYNYSENLGEEICLDKIKDKIWMLLGFLLQSAVSGFKPAEKHDSLTFAKRELDRILDECEDSESIEMQSIINNDVLDMVDLFGSQGHSGFSASYARNILMKLLDYKPLSPLTGEDDEWMDAWDDEELQQNKRCYSVFRKNKDNSTAFNTAGKIFSDNGGISWFTRGGGASAVPVVFPYAVPDKSEKVYLDETGERVITDEKEIKELHDRVSKEYDEECKEAGL